MKVMSRRNDLKHRGESIAEVYVAACSGSARLSEEIGLPLVHIDAAEKSGPALTRLNEIEHGCGVRRPGFFQPIDLEYGWTDWGLFPIDDVCRRHVGILAASGVRVVNGRILVRLPFGTPLAEFAEHLHSALRHLRIQDVTSSMDYMIARSDALAPYTVHPRYSMTAPRSGFRTARIVTDLYVFDPSETPERLFWIVVAARFSAVAGLRVRWG